MIPMVGLSASGLTRREAHTHPFVTVSVTPEPDPGEPLRGRHSSATMHTPLQRLKRLNNVHSLANAVPGGHGRMRKTYDVPTPKESAEGPNASGTSRRLGRCAAWAG